MKQASRCTQGARRARRLQRGGVAVEGVIVVVMMTGIVVGISFMRTVYSGKLLTMTSSRAAAWKDALNGCDGSDKLTGLYDTLHEQSKDPNNKVCPDPKDCSNGNVDGLGADGTSPPPDWFPKEEGSETSRSISVAEGGLYATTLTTAQHYSCNELPHKEMQLGGALDGVLNAIKKIPDEEVKSDQVAHECWWYLLFKWKKHSCDEYQFSAHGGKGVDPLHTYTQLRDLQLPDPPKNPQ